MIPLEIASKKNLLAFSAGIDSTALFFILLENNIPFDIAIVDYNLREQSKDEVIYAHQLAIKYNKQIYLKEYPQNLNFSEKSARDFRYNFFEELIQFYKYQTLLTAHQLNDKLEWFLMQLSKGAGLVELIGMKKIDIRDNIKYLKPLLEYSKDQLQEYLDNKNIRYFIDETNIDLKYKRNYIRKEFANSFLDEYENGVKNSFKYLENDLNTLDINIKPQIIKELSIFNIQNLNQNQIIRVIDKELKRRGIVISFATRKEILKQKEIVISHNISITITNTKIWIAPYIDNIIIDKKIKEKYRINKIPKNIRVYLYKINFINQHDIKDLKINL
jgi:tRNA(Ile)-lysidine synthase